MDTNKKATNKKVGVNLFLRSLDILVENVSTNYNNATTLITFFKLNTFPIEYISKLNILCIHQTLK